MEVRWDIRTVLWSKARGERSYDIWSRRLRERIGFRGVPVDDASANLVIAQLRFLEGEDAEKPVHLYINSPGGDMTAFFAIHDTMRFLRPPVSTMCIGQAASAAAVLLAAGEPGMRYTLPNARVLIHQPHGGAQRSEEHTSELQSLMRTSYAVFCLTKNTKEH